MNKPSVMHSDVLVLQQIRDFAIDQYDIEDAEENVIGHVINTDSRGARFFRGCREFDIVDAEGEQILHVSDISNWRRVAVEISLPDGAVLAQVEARVSFFSRKIAIVTDDDDFITRGNYFKREFEIIREGSEEVVAEVFREYAGFARSFMGHDRYSLHFGSPLAAEERLSIMGSMVALDLMREKAKVRD